MWHDRRWSLFLGHWGQTAVFLHASVLPVVLGTLYIGWLVDRDAGSDHTSLVLAVLAAACWLISITVHELARGAVARATGLAMPEVVVGPVGNLATPPAVRNVRAAFWTALSGAVAHWVICTVAAGMLLLLHTPWESFVGLLHPFRPTLTVMGDTLGFSSMLMRLVFWCNWLLLLLHLLPVWPFDGMQIWQNGLLSLFPDLSRRTVASYVAHLARWVAVGLLVLAWAMREDGAGSIMPTWLPLVGLAALVYLHARILPSPLELPWNRAEGAREENVDAEIPAASLLVGDEEEYGHERLDAGNWWQRQQQRRRASELARQVEEDAQVDEILRRVHKSGIDGISRADRDLLMRVSQRWRRERRQSGGGAVD